jgi:transposase-like protein
MKCPKCGEEMRLIDKNTFTAEEIREYLCEACRETVVDRGGIALWKALSDAKGERE